VGRGIRNIFDTVKYLVWVAVVWVESLIAWRRLPESRPSERRIIGWFVMLIMLLASVMWSAMVLIELNGQRV
jgi:hypothetical protein